MPTIFCSSKLASFIGLKTRLPSIVMNNWNAHLFTLQKRKCIAFVHKETFYSFVLFDILKKDLKNLKQLFLDAFLKQLAIDGLHSVAIEQTIIQDFYTFDISTTDGDKSTIGYLSDCIARVSIDREGNPETIAAASNYVQSRYYNENLISAKNFARARELMAEKLKP